MQFNSCSSFLALAILCPLEEWCLNSARTTATLGRSCLSRDRRRRSLQPRAAPSPTLSKELLGGGGVCGGVAVVMVLTCSSAANVSDPG